MVQSSNLKNLQTQKKTYKKRHSGKTRRYKEKRSKGPDKINEGSFEFFLTNPNYHEANFSKKEQLLFEEELGSEAADNFEPPRVIVQMSTKNSSEVAVAQLPIQCCVDLALIWLFSACLC